MNAPITWPQWAHSVPNVTPTQRLVLIELARLADVRGAAIVEISHLVTTTARSRMSIFRALAALEERTLVTREARRSYCRQAPSRFQLHLTTDHARKPTPTSKAAAASNVPMAAQSATTARPINPNDQETLVALIRQAQHDDWQGEAALRLAATILAEGGEQFHTGILAGRRNCTLGIREAELDTYSIAWETLQTHADTIIHATRPWAMWTTIVVNTCKQRDREAVAPTTSTDPTLMPENGLRPGQGDTDQPPEVSIDDFQGPLAQIVQALVQAGMSQTLAWAGTRRIVELAVDGDTSRRITAAGKDLRLADMGVNSECARQWMTLLTGNRRGTKTPAAQMSPEELAQAARALVRQLQTT